MRSRGPLRFLPFAFVGVFWGDVHPLVILAVAVGGVATVLWLTRGTTETPVEEERPHDPLAVDVATVGRRLTEVGHPELAQRLVRGLEDLWALRAFHDRLGDLDDQRKRAWVEEQNLRSRAEAAQDPEARATWTESADTAARRIAKLDALRVEWDRAAARIEAYTQMVKSLKVDLARMDAAPDAAGRMALGERLEREVDALVRAREEVRRIEGGAGSAGAL